MRKKKERKGENGATGFLGGQGRRKGKGKRRARPDERLTDADVIRTLRCAAMRRAAEAPSSAGRARPTGRRGARDTLIRVVTGPGGRRRTLAGGVRGGRLYGLYRTVS